MGVFKRGKKLWISFTYKGMQCKESLHLDDTPRNREEAEIMMSQIKRQIQDGTFDYEKWFPKSTKLVKLGLKNPQNDNEYNPTIAELCEEWITISKKKFKKKTIKSYKEYAQRTIPILGNKKIKDVTLDDLDNFIEELYDFGYSPKTIKNTKICINQVFDIAMRKNLVDVNLPSRVRKITIPPSNIDPFTPNEVEAILSHIKKYYPRFYAMFSVLILTGMRIGEVLGMKWKFLNLDNGTYYIMEAMTDGILDTPKTIGSIRKIKLHPDVIDALKYHKKFYAVKDSEFIFNTQYGKAYTTAESIRKNVWKPTLEALNIKYRIMYHCRHTYASMALLAGDPPVKVARNLGHTSVQMVYRVYGRFIDDGEESKLNNKRFFK
ncbi:phage integrase [Deferribacter desulfuricans SSM1]|uniref:Phage integrase n=1 Tax=Deferribacter desulfuricans (strain DSM 14783 / JCM 11476 / NBRC 101012 / SSM1) TaxID=639282 RepID=D3PC65_DEFDS|nr:site-specific integrase [Deferribacter desulfuricans]BAI80188.1 phage integrase [Deferribacter desulfuricans SSM1]